MAGDRPDLLAVVRCRWLPDAVVAGVSRPTRRSGRDAPRERPTSAVRSHAGATGHRGGYPGAQLDEMLSVDAATGRVTVVETKRGRHAAPAPEEGRSARSLLQDLPRLDRVPSRAGPSCACWCWPAPPTTPPPSTSPPAPSCGSGSPGPRTTRRTWRPSTWSRRRWPTTPSETTWPSPRRPPRLPCRRQVGTCGASGPTHASAAGGPAARAAPGLPGPPPPTGSSAAPALGRLGHPARSPAHPAARRRLDLGPVRLGARGRLAAGRGQPCPPVPRRRPPGAAGRQASGHGAGLRPPLPAGHAQPAAPGPLLQGVHGGPALFERGGGGGKGRDGCGDWWWGPPGWRHWPPAPVRGVGPRARSSAMAQPKATSRSPRSEFDLDEELGHLGGQPGPWVRHEVAGRRPASRRPSARRPGRRASLGPEPLGQAPARARSSPKACGRCPGPPRTGRKKARKPSGA